MARLTKKDEYGNADILGMDSGDLLNLDFGSFNKVTNALNKLAEYEDLEEQGLLLRLPCKVGDTVFPIFKIANLNCELERVCKENEDLKINNNDLVVIKHGKWIWNPNGMDWGLGAWQCSECHNRNSNLPMDNKINPLAFSGSKYCPNCGAKMDLE